MNLKDLYLKIKGWMPKIIAGIKIAEDLKKKQ